MADRMRANVVEAKNGTYTSISPANATKKINCTTATCTTTEIAENDLFEWNAALKEGIPKTGEITYIAPVFTIAICLDQYLKNGKCPLDDDSSDYSFKDDYKQHTFKTDFQL
jgi:type IV pilus assembly protein PilV